jgi:hypothetical protein
MKTFTPPVLRSVLVAATAAAVLGASGCRLERRPIVTWAQVQPAQVCPGEAVTASFDFLREETCRDEAACRSHHPNVVISSAPTAFPTRHISGYSDSFTFTPDADSTRVLFDIDRDAVRIPTIRTDPDGTRIDVVREQVLDSPLTVTRISGSVETELLHEGMCAGGAPVNASATLPGPPRTSANLRLRQLCNANGVPVTVTLTGDSPGSVFSQDLRPGECLDTGMPGAPDGLDMAREIDVRPMLVDPGVRCSAVGPSTPPQTLRTIARQGCP